MDFICKLLAGIRFDLFGQAGADAEEALREFEQRSRMTSDDKMFQI